MNRVHTACHAAGGAVRDLLLGRGHRDVDYVCIGSQVDFIQRNPTARKIEKGAFSLYLLNGQEYGLLEAPPGQEEKALCADIARRDFTINALLLSENGVIRSHPSSLDDLRQRVIRPAGPDSLLADPVRVLRAARFSAEFPDFRLHADSLGQMRAASGKGLLSGIAAEQAGKECLKACGAPRPGNFLRALHRTGALAPWFAEFAEGGDKPAGPPAFHDSTVLEHSACVMDEAALLSLRNRDRLPGRRTAPLAVWMALCHDIGKCLTTTAILPHHIGHEKLGGGLALALGKRLRLPALFCRAGKLAAELHMKAGRYAVLRPGTKVDLLLRVHAAHVAAPFFIAVAADSGLGDLPSRMEQDLQLVLGVSLPPLWRNRGAASGERLRQMRCEAVAACGSG